MRTFFTIIIVLFSFSSFAVGIDENDRITDAGNAYIAADVAGPGEGFRSAVQLWNPVDSGKVVYLDKVTLAHGFCIAKSGADLRVNFEYREY